ncbi:hypothetical protein AWENTII_008890 [Aspergillus wentii]
MTFINGLFSRLSQHHVFQPLPSVDPADDVPTPQKDFRAYSVSPFQLWLNRPIGQIIDGTFDNESLPYFSKSTAYLQARFRPLSEGRKWEFFWQWDVAGLLLIGGFLEACAICALLAAPFALHLFLQDLHNVSYLVFLATATFLATLSRCAKDQICRVQSNQIDTMLRSAIFQHGLRLSPESRKAYPAGKIINLSTNDVRFIKNYILKVHEIWSAPLQLAFIMVLIVRLIGLSGLCGMAGLMQTAVTC